MASSYYITIHFPYFDSTFPKFNNALREGTPLDTKSNKATICVLPKPNKDHSNVIKYGPDSLINNDLNLLAKNVCQQN